jgi:hypothetical protein
MRLGKVMDKIMRVGQKAFSGKKYCQEVLIGIVDSINHLKFRRKCGALLSLDKKKPLIVLPTPIYNKCINFSILVPILLNGLT